MKKKRFLASEPFIVHQLHVFLLGETLTPLIAHRKLSFNYVGQLFVQIHLFLTSDPLFWRHRLLQNAHKKWQKHALLTKFNTKNTFSFLFGLLRLRFNFLVHLCNVTLELIDNASALQLHSWRQQFVINAERFGNKQNAGGLNHNDIFVSKVNNEKPVRILSGPLLGRTVATHLAMPRELWNFYTDPLGFLWCRLSLDTTE